MARTKATARRDKPLEKPIIPQDLPASVQSSSLLQYPILVMLSMFSSSILYSVASPFMRGDLSTVSGHRDQWWEVAGLLSFKSAEIAVSWYGGFDVADVAAVTYLSNLPYLYLLTSFYSVRPTSMWTCLGVDVISAALPFYLLRSLAPSHNIQTPKGAAANRSVINDYGVQVLISVLAAGIYSVVVFGSFATWLPVYLITHFDDIRDITALYDAKFPYMIATFIPAGLAAKVFLFTPSAATKPDEHDKEMARFNPETAGLLETILYNLWGYSKRTRLLVQRSALLFAVSSSHTILHTCVAVEGAEVSGAVGWASMWALAAMLTGSVYWWVEDVEGMSN